MQFLVRIKFKEKWEERAELIKEEINELPKHSDKKWRLNLFII